MPAATVKALTMMGVALPTMFLVIFVFMAATRALHKTFPASEESEDDDD